MTDILLTALEDDALQDLAKQQMKLPHIARPTLVAAKQADTATVTCQSTACMSILLSQKVTLYSAH